MNMEDKCICLHVDATWAFLTGILRSVSVSSCISRAWEVAT